MSVSVTVRIDSAVVRAALKRAPRQISRAMVAGMEDATTYLLGEVKAYPSKPSGSRYRRTNTLKRSWRRSVDNRGRLSAFGGRIRGIVDSDGSIAPYNRYVQDERQQARVHRGRWDNTAQGVVRRGAGRVARMFEDRLRLT